MPDTFLLTIIFIALVTVVTAFVKGKSKDRCLVDFRDNMVHLKMTNGKEIWGKLLVESTGLEFNYTAAHDDEEGHQEFSYIVYKTEYPQIISLVLYHDDLDEKHRKIRLKEIKRTYHPNFFRRLKRKTRNFFATVRDSLLELVNLFIGQAKKITPAQTVLTSQQKHVDQVKEKLFGLTATAYEPLLERHIGKKMVLEIPDGDKAREFVGVLRDYTAEFIEIIDVDYKIDNGKSKKADLVVPRSIGVIRHLAE